MQYGCDVLHGGGPSGSRLSLAKKIARDGAIVWRAPLTSHGSHTRLLGLTWINAAQADWDSLIEGCYAASVAAKWGDT